MTQSDSSADGSADTAPRRPQLVMTWPAGRRPPRSALPAGYRLRSLRKGEEAAHAALMQSAGFSGWTREKVAHVREQALPGGIQVVEHKASGRLAATASAVHRPTEQYPGGGELGWVAAEPDHRGLGLGAAVCTAVLRRFLRAGYRHIYLKTDDYRLPALRVYLELGFEPGEDNPHTAARWQTVRASLKNQAPRTHRPEAVAAVARPTRRTNTREPGAQPAGGGMLRAPHPPAPRRADTHSGSPSTWQHWPSS